MKKNIMKWALMLALVATPFAFTSCGDDDDPQVPQKKEEPQKTLVKKEVTYQVTVLDNNVFDGDLFNLKVAYYDGNNEAKVEEINGNFRKTVTFNAEKNTIVGIRTAVFLKDDIGAYENLTEDKKLKTNSRIDAVNHYSDNTTENVKIHDSSILGGNELYTKDEIIEMFNSTKQAFGKPVILGGSYTLVNRVNENPFDYQLLDDALGLKKRNN
jgi:hypothetical protein